MSNYTCKDVARLTSLILDAVNTVVKGKQSAAKKVLCTILAKGHVLIEDIPGVGKTTLAIAFAKAMKLKQRSIQFTPDVMASDVTGFNMYNKETGKFTFVDGAVMCNLLLADEINRTSPKTQSALLEAMEEGKVTVDKNVIPIPRPFTVIATQNPLGFTGTQPLPEAQLDRFTICISMGYPSMENEIDIMRMRAKGGSTAQRAEAVEEVASAADLVEMQAAVEEVRACDEMLEYIYKLVFATRTNPLIEMGASPRASINLLRCAKAMAAMEGRDYIIPLDAAEMFLPIVSHRITLARTSGARGKSTKEVLEGVFSSVKPPKLTIR